MVKKQNPTTEGRVLRNSLVGASAESFILSVYRAQHLINAYGVRPEWAAILASMVFGGGDSHG